jgi:hypothetical protein
LGKTSLLQNDAKIWFLITLYGLAAGVISYVSTLSYEDQQMDSLAFAMNYPFFVVMLVTLTGVSISEFLVPVVIIAGSAAAWSLIGFVIYLFVKMFRLGP